MTIVHLSGGFGNQLFSYAFGYRIAKERDDKLAIDTAIQDQKWFFRNPDIMNMNITYDKHITYPITRKILDRAIFNKLYFRKAIGFKTKFITEDELKQQENPIKYLKSIKGNIYIKGDWQAMHWIDACLDEVVLKYEFKNELSQEAQLLAEKITEDDASVAVHIRRGDYVRIGIALQKEFYIEAMEMLSKKVDNPTFYVFSEDMEWAKNAFKDLPYKIEYARYESENAGIEDFRLISMAKHQIISNSSYSWWAAYLNKNKAKMIICPELDNYWRGDFYPDNWTRIKAETIGKVTQG